LFQITDDNSRILLYPESGKNKEKVENAAYLCQTGVCLGVGDAQFSPNTQKRYPKFFWLTQHFCSINIRVCTRNFVSAKRPHMSEKGHPNIFLKF